MNRVYIVLDTVRYEGSSICSLHDSKKGAKLEARKLAEDAARRWNYPNSEITETETGYAVDDRTFHVIGRDVIKCED
jgi:hypothetical protein